MQSRCERCDDPLEDGGSGLLSKFGLGSSAGGYECENCGAGFCEDCYRRRRRELRGSTHDVCPVCGSMLQHR